MSELITGDQRVRFSFECDAGHAFEVLEFTLEEGLSTPFNGQLTLVSEDELIQPQSMMNQPASLCVYQGEVLTRRFNGIVSAFTLGDSGYDYTRYHITLVPSLVRSGLRHNSRIFQHQTVETIVRTLLTELHITEMVFQLHDAHAKRAYTVQYRETDLDFMHRILAEEGISYYFDVTDEGHRIVFTDNTSLSFPIDAPFFYAPLASGKPDHPYIHHFALHNEIRPTSATLESYFFQSPRFALTQQASGALTQTQNGEYPYYDYPGRYTNLEVGQQFSAARIDYLRRDALTATGESTLAPLLPGGFGQLEGHPQAALNQAWLITYVRHHGKQAVAMEHYGTQGEATYHNTFSAMPLQTKWRPMPEPKPAVGGPHVAEVVGPEGEEIYCDEWGRVKVKFRWDRTQTPDPRDASERTCWLRISEGWAGAGRGMIALPRVGDEVIVSFLEGDPDRPLITGRTYHSLNRQPYKLPDHKTITGIKTQTHKGDGYNELYFDDENDKQLIRIHAEKDFDLKVKNVKNERIDYDHQLSIGHDQRIDIANHRTMTIEGEQHLTTKGSHIELREADSSLEVSGDVAQAIKGALGTKVNSHMVLESNQQITFKVGGSFIVLHSGGVHIQGSVVTVNSGGTPGDVVIPTTPKVLDGASGEGKAFVFHCPLAAKAKQAAMGSEDDVYESLVPEEQNPLDWSTTPNGVGEESPVLGGFGELSGMLRSADALLNSVGNIVDNPMNAMGALGQIGHMAGLTELNKATRIITDVGQHLQTFAQAKEHPLRLAESLGLPKAVTGLPSMSTPGFNPNGKL